MRVRTFVLRGLAMSLVFAFAVSGASVALADVVTLPITVNAGGNYFPVADAKTLDVDAFVNGPLAAGVERAPVNASRKLNARKVRFDFTAPVDGVVLDRAGSAAILRAFVEAHKDDTMTPAAQEVILPASAVAPKITKLNKVILVSLKQRRIYLYDNRSVVAKYRCAIGMARYPTPTGTFEIRRKVRMPSWTNPGGAWGAGLPKYIKPGPSNPLGTRALYLYRNGSDTGIRFHGTTKRGSIGHAASHGCMRMRREDVEKFYNQVPMYTDVHIVKY